MYIKETHKIAKGVHYIQHQLIRSNRTAAGPRQELVLNLGQLSIPKPDWKILANAIEEKLLQTRRLFPHPAEIESLAEHYAQIIIQNNLIPKKEISDSIKASVSDAEQPDFEMVDTTSVEHTDDKSYGAEHIVTSVMESFDFDTILKEAGLGDHQIMLAKMLIGSRMIHPASERETARWLNEASTFPEFFGKTDTVIDTSLHRVADILWKNHDFIEKKLSNTAKTLFSLQEKVILYDLTNTYFEGSKHKSTIASCAHSKEKRSDCPLLTLALTVDEQGFPKKSKVFEGKISEASTLATFLRALKADAPDEKPTIVMDAGIATEANLALIAGEEFGYSYVVVSRKSNYSHIQWDDQKRHTTLLADDKTTLTMQSHRTDTEVYLRCHSEAKEIKETAIYQQRFERFEAEMAHLQAGLQKLRGMKSPEKINQKIGRLKEKYHVGSYYSITIKTDTENTLVQSITVQRTEKSVQLDSRIGHYILRTNRLDLTDIEISEIHRSLTTIEDSFRSMKSHLGLRPIFHKTDDRCEAHIYLTVLAYYFVRAILKQIQNADIEISYNWNSIREILSTHRRVSTTMKTMDGRVICLRQNTKITEKQRIIYNSLGSLVKKGLGRIKNIIEK